MELHMGLYWTTLLANEPTGNGDGNMELMNIQVTGIV